MLDIEKLNEIKRTAIIALFSDDDLMDSLVLKGGNALDIVYGIAQRASLDLDFSIDKEFDKAELSQVDGKIRKVLRETFKARGHEVFDVQFIEVPEHPNAASPEFWGGYLIQFKIIETAKFESLRLKPHALRVNALEVGPDHKRVFKISISKLEYCAPKREIDLDDYTIYVYSPEMIVFEKLRAICQQMPGYALNTTKTARARDFFDIYTVMEHFEIDFTAPHNVELLRLMFEAKQVPVSLIQKIEANREYHRPDFTSVEATAKPGAKLKPFDFYFDFDYVVDKCKSLETLWEI